MTKAIKRIAVFLLVSIGYTIGIGAQGFSYTVVENEILYFSERSADIQKNDLLITCDLVRGVWQESYIAVVRDSYFPNCWEKTNDNKIVYVSAYGLGATIVKIKSAELDEQEMKLKTYLNYDSLILEIGETKALHSYLQYKDSLANEKILLPISEWLKLCSRSSNRETMLDIYEFLSLDVLHKGRDAYKVFLRNKHEFSIWEFTYLKYGRGKSSSDNWEELITYSNDTVPYQPFGNATDRVLPSGKHHRYEAIGDSRFFEGHFKVIAQDGEYYYINIDTGLLYHIGDQDIVRVGALDVDNYPRWLFGKPLFIEDRDTGELVFFSTVERTNTKRPFPKIVSLSSKEALYERYPGLKGK
ncbi:MAG: hypothetical protein HRU12_20450 [Phaeodactylibacter sp.]|nr:hypothetical protein [Phaeodactylibacter sp.]